MTELDLIYIPPKLPSKWDIIPIHTSDVASFLGCRRKWDWSSPSRRNLRHKVGIFGINMNFWFGNGIHYALEMHYNPALKRDPVEAFQTWFQIQWEGGVVTEDWLERCYDPNPKPVLPELVQGLQNSGVEMSAWKEDATQWQVQGLRDLHPNPDESEFFFHRDLGIGMLTYYRDYYAPKYDDFRVIAAESSFSIPLGFEALDMREDSPNYGKMLDVHARGKRDGIVQNIYTNRYGLIDHKTAAKIDEEYFLKLEKDPQVSNYHWASIKEAMQHDLPWADLDFVIYNAIRKNYPKPPTMTSRGVLSLDRANEGTTAELFAEAIKEHNLQVWFDSTEKAQLYYNYLVEQADKLFVQRDIVHRNAHEIKATQTHLVMIAKDMTSSPSLYPAPSGSRSCTRCVFRGPCIAADDGSDWQTMLVDGYEENRGR